MTRAYSLYVPSSADDISIKGGAVAIRNSRDGKGAWKGARVGLFVRGLLGSIEFFVLLVNCQWRCQSVPMSKCLNPRLNNGCRKGWILTRINAALLHVVE